MTSIFDLLLLEQTFLGFDLNYNISAFLEPNLIEFIHCEDFIQVNIT